MYSHEDNLEDEQIFKKINEIRADLWIISAFWLQCMTLGWRESNTNTIPCKYDLG